MDELLLTAMAVVASVAASAATLGYWIGRRLTRLEARIDGLDGEVKSVGARVEAVRRELIERLERLGTAFVGYQEFFTELLVSEKVIDRDKGVLARNEARRVFALALQNPLTKEEWRRLKELFDKEELTVEEAEEFLQLARRVALEYGTYEAWKLHIYATIQRALAIRKEAERDKAEKAPGRGAAEEDA